MCTLYKRFNDFLDSTFGKTVDVTDFFFLGITVVVAVALGEKISIEEDGNKTAKR